MMRIVTETDLDAAGNVVAVRAYSVGTTPVPPQPPVPPPETPQPQPPAPLPPTQPPPPAGAGENIPYGDFGRRFFLSEQNVPTVFNFIVPAPPFPGPNGALLRLSVAENQGRPHLRRTSLSLIPGDMNGPLWTEGKETMLAFQCGDTFPYGERVYINTMAIEDVSAINTHSSVSIVWPPHEYP